VTNILAIVLGGGKGTRLYPLTKQRAKPAVPFGGKYRLVDIPISNCINSGIRKMYVLTQFNSVSLHNHIAHTYIFDTFSKGFVEILAAEQTFESSSWYQGTADAVRKNFSHFFNQKPTHYIVLSGDQLYRMDFRKMINEHIDNKAEITIAATPVSRTNADELGILKIDKESKITTFIEKPGPDRKIPEMKIPASFNTGKNDGEEKKDYLASMGMYIFNADVLEKCLDNSYTDFGKEIIPEAINKYHINGYIFNDYWMDIGTIKTFYDANINLASLNPSFNFYDEKMPIYAHRRDLPATKMNFCTISQSLAAEGSIITNASIINSVIGIRTLIESGANLDGVIGLGATRYESAEEKAQNREKGITDLGIGRGTIIKNTILDTDVRIGDGCRIGIDNIERKDGEYDNYYIDDGIIIVPRGCSLSAGTVI